MERDQIVDIIKKYGNRRDRLLDILLKIQKKSPNNYLSEEDIETVGRELKIDLPEIYGVVTFYSMLSLEPRGKYVFEICKSCPCHVCGSNDIVSFFKEILGISPGETTKDGLITLQYTNCVGACDIGPIVKVGENIYGNLDKEKVQNIINLCREGLI